MNGQEKSPEISNGHTTALFWEYDSRIAKRWNLDPRPVTGISPYATFQGNPVWFSDPLGDTIKFAGPEEKVAYENFLSETETRIKYYQTKVDNIKDRLAKRGKTTNRKLRYFEGLVDGYMEVKSEISVLEKSSEIFRIRLGENVSNTDGAGNFTYNPKTGELDLNLHAVQKWDLFTMNEKVAHELKHAFQYTQHKLAFAPNGAPLQYDQTDEIEAFERQRMYIPLGSDRTIDAQDLGTKGKYKNLPSSTMYMTPHQLENDTWPDTRERGTKGESQPIIFFEWKKYYNNEK